MTFGEFFLWVLLGVSIIVLVQILLDKDRVAAKNREAATDMALRAAERDRVYERVAAKRHEPGVCPFHDTSTGTVCTCWNRELSK